MVRLFSDKKSKVRLYFIVGLVLFSLILTVIVLAASDDLDVTTCGVADAKYAACGLSVAYWNDKSYILWAGEVESAGELYTLWDNPASPSADAVYTSVYFSIYHDGQNGINGAWTIQFESEAETLYCSDSSINHRDTNPGWDYVNITNCQSGGDQVWTTAELDDLRIEYFSGDTANNDNAWLYDAELELEWYEPTYGHLNVTHLTPADDYNVSQNNTFILNATVVCTDGATAVCGDVRAYARFNESATADTLINNTGGAVPFHHNETNNYFDCGSMSVDESCTAKFYLNATGESNLYELDVFFNSSLGAATVPNNHTADITVNISESIILDSCTPTADANWTITHNCTKSGYVWNMSNNFIRIGDGGSLIMNTGTNITIGCVNITHQFYAKLNVSANSKFNITGGC